MNGHEIGLALSKKILSTLKTLMRLIGPEVSSNTILTSTVVPQTGKREDGIYAVYEGNCCINISQNKEKNENEDKQFFKSSNIFFLHHS
jgi:hypothetical protein